MCLAAHPGHRKTYVLLKAETTSTDYLFAFAGFTVTGELVAAGLVAAGGCVGACVGCELVAPAAAGRSPRLPGLFSMLVARLFEIFASFMAVSSNAALRICLR